jgi:hypothetical protein
LGQFGFAWTVHIIQRGSAARHQHQQRLAASTDFVPFAM